MVALRGSFVRNVSSLAAGAAVVQGSLLVSTPFILYIYGASAFGLFTTVLAFTSVISSLASLRLDAVIPVIEARFRALRLVSAAVGIVGAITVAAYTVVALVFVCYGGPGRWLGELGTFYLLWVPAVALSQTLLIICRAWMVRSQAFRLAVLCNLTRVAVFISMAIGLGVAVADNSRYAVNGILIAQVCGDFAGICLFLCRSRRRELRLIVPRSIKRPLAELRNNKSLIGTASLTGLLSITNANIPIWTISYVFGLTATGWFSAAQRVVTAPVQFTIDTLGVTFNQRVRERRSKGLPIMGEVLQVTVVLILALAPVFIALGWLAHSERLGFLGPEWTGAGPTLAAMVLISFGSIFYSAVEGLPLVFRLQRILLVSSAARLATTAALAAAALSALVPYATWIYLYAVCEMLLYGGNALAIAACVYWIEAPSRFARKTSPVP